MSIASSSSTAPATPIADSRVHDVFIQRPDLRRAMVKLSRALNSPGCVDAGADQCVEARLIEMAAERLAAR